MQNRGKVQYNFAKWNVRAHRLGSYDFFGPVVFCRLHLLLGVMYIRRGFISLVKRGISL